MPVALIRAAVRFLDSAAKLLLQPPPAAAHQQLGAAGEEEAYFYLRQQGYVVVARNYRCRSQRGEVDLIAWDGDTLCFVEVKTRTTRAVKPAEAAVDLDKQTHVRSVARDYLRRVAGSPPCRFDVVSVYREAGPPQITLFKNAFAIS